MSTSNDVHASSHEAHGRRPSSHRHIGLLHAQSRRSNESLELGRLAHEALADEGHLRDHSLPRLALSLAALEHLEELLLGHGSHTRQRHVPLARLLATTLLQLRREHARTLRLRAIDEEVRHGAVGGGVGGRVHVRLLALDGLALATHRRLLRVAFGTVAQEWRSFVRGDSLVV